MHLILPPTVRVERWCKLRGNLLFYLKDKDPKSAVAGLLVLENCRARIQNEERDSEGYVFDLGRQQCTMMLCYDYYY